ncbi:MAG: FAD-dependent oxidoreductase [Lentisphaeria bacterium]|nr:FAD-dependent oxidoreductase [Lentisphaeria bacterium]
MKQITGLTKCIPVTGDFDVVIAGGGLSGMAAAYNAAKRGLSVCVLEYYSKLGGVPASGLLGIVSGFRLDNEICVDGPFLRELVSRAEKYQAVRSFKGWSYRFDCELLPLILMEMADDYGVEIRLLSPVADSVSDGGRISSAVVASRRGLEAVTGKLFIDDTGDGLLAVSAGAGFEYGRPEDGKVQSSSLTFRVGGIDPGKIPSGMPEATKIWRSEQHNVPTDHTVITYLPGSGREASVNMTHILNCDPLTDEGIDRIRKEGLKQALEIVDFFRSRLPGFSNCRLLESAMQPGIRESRRIIGDYTLTADDVIHGRDFPDQIARGCWGIDIHMPDKVHSTSHLPHFNIPRSYGIPYRCITPQKLENCFVIGKAVSATHEACASCRINATCIALGEAAGTAAPRAIDCGDIHEVDTELLRKKLQEQGNIVDYTPLAPGAPGE